MNHTRIHHLVLHTTILTILLTSTAPVRAQDSISGIIETNGYVADWLRYLADTSYELGGEVLGIIETHGYVEPEEMQAILETHGYVIEDLQWVVATLDEAIGPWLDTHDEDAVSLDYPGTGAIGIASRDTGAINVIPMGTGAINVTPACEVLSTTWVVTEALAAVATTATPDTDPDTTVEALQALGAVLDAAAIAPDPQ